MQIRVHVKQLGKKKRAVEPVIYELEREPVTTEELIVEMVKTCVRDYNRRRENQELLQALSSQQIADQAESGKISFGINYGEQSADPSQAVENALQSFDDGIFRIFQDMEELTERTQKLQIQETTVFTFVRMTMLSGRLW